MNREMDELLVERFPILREKQILFLVIYFLIPVSITPGSWFNGKSESFAVSFFVLVLVSTWACFHCCCWEPPSIHQHSWLPVCCKGKLRFCHSGSASLLPFQGLPPEACGSFLHPPLYPHGFSPNLKLFPETSFLEPKALKLRLRPGLTQSWLQWSLAWCGFKWHWEKIPCP